MMSLTISIISLIISSIVGIIVYIKIKSIFINLYRLSKGMDVLYANQEKILELTKIKGFVELVSEEEKQIKKELLIEKTTDIKKPTTKEYIRPLESDKSGKES